MHLHGSWRVALTAPSQRTAILLLLVTIAGACSGVTDAPPDEEPPAVEPPPREPPPDPAPVYRVEPPQGRLPWPQHNPQWDEAQYRQMLADLWIVNNFGAYQGGAARSGLYLHNGLDIVLPNGTPVYAIAAGTVRANIGGSEFYRTLVIEDEANTGFAWSYTHINDFTVRPGDRVHRGTMIGRVRFQGIEHVHLNREMLVAGGSWTSYEDLISLHSDHHFVLEDTEPPVFSPPFRYVRNDTDAAFAADDDGVTVVSGDVDVVVGLRDPGEWARSKRPFGGPLPYGDRNTPMRVEYDIVAPGGAVHSFVAFDFSRIMLMHVPVSARLLQVLTLYQHYESVSPAPPPLGNANQRLGFYVITNSSGAEPALRPLDPGDQSRAWHTAATDAQGRPRFPNGDYTITVRAYDSKQNVAKHSETVRVRN